jgi:hypothetical protein
VRERTASGQSGCGVFDAVCHQGEAVERGGDGSGDSIENVFGCDPFSQFGGEGRDIGVSDAAGHDPLVRAQVDIAVEGEPVVVTPR